MRLSAHLGDRLHLATFISSTNPAEAPGSGYHLPQTFRSRFKRCPRRSPEQEPAQGPTLSARAPANCRDVRAGFRSAVFCRRWIVWPISFTPRPRIGSIAILFAGSASAKKSLAAGRPEILEDVSPLLLLGIPLPADPLEPPLLAVSVFLTESVRKSESQLEAAAAAFGVSVEEALQWVAPRTPWHPQAAVRMSTAIVEKLATQQSRFSSKSKWRKFPLTCSTRSKKSRCSTGSPSTFRSPRASSSCANSRCAGSPT